jgi:MFS family permease
MRVFTAAFCTFGNTFSLVIIYPMVAFMVASFYPELEKSELGWRASYLAAAFNFGQLFGSMLFGWLSDKYGRRPIMIGGLVGTTATILLFGFSSSYWMALSARSLWGFLNANVGIAKTYMAEICDDTNQAKGLATLGFGTGLARLIAPVVGGALAQPATKWPNVFSPDGMFGKFAFVLPCWIGAAIATISLVTSVLFLKETLVREPPAASNSMIEDGIPLAVTGAPPPAAPKKKQKLDRFLAVQLLRSKKVMVSCILYTLLGMCVSALSEVLPLWALLPIAEGGFSMDSTEIGFLLLIGAPLQLIGQVFVFDRAVRRFGFLRTFQLAMTWVGLWVFLMPFAHEMASDNVYATWAVLAISWAMVSAVWMFAFTATFGLINNSTLAKNRGTANGLSQSMVAIGRIVGPIFGGNTFAWSASGGHSWPFDFHFVFHLIGITMWITAGLAFILPKSIDRKLETVLAEEEAQNHAALLANDVLAHEDEINNNNDNNDNSKGNENIARALALDENVELEDEKEDDRGRK